MTNNKKILAAGSIGNFLDSYDLGIYIFLSPYIAKIFFAPEYNSKLFYTFLVFFVGYLARPFGSLLFGIIADKKGRRKSLLISIIAMALTTAAIGLLPGYQQIGAWATTLLLFIRILQGIAFSGEYTTSIIYLIEHARGQRTGWFGTWATMGVNLGIFCAVLIALWSTSLIHSKITPLWTFRIPFLLASLGALFGIWLRRFCPETLEFILNNSTSQQFTLKNHFREIKTATDNLTQKSLTVFALVILGTTATYLIYTYAPIFYCVFHHLPTYLGLMINLVSIILLILLLPWFGYLSDKYDRKKFLIFSTMIFLLFAYPFFWSVEKGSFNQFLIFHLIMSLAGASYYGIASVVIVEMMPSKVRATLSTSLYGIASSIFGGAAPLIAIALAKKSGLTAAPSFYLIGCCLFCLSMIFLCYEKSYPVKSANI